MFSNMVIAFQRSSRVSKWLVGVASLCCILYGVATVVFNTKGSVQEDTGGFIMTSAPVAITPFALMLFYLLSTHYGAFDLLRRDPRTEFYSNLCSVPCVSVLSSAANVVVFVFLEYVVYSHSLSLSDCSMLLLFGTRLFILAMTMCLIELLFICCGLPWGLTTSVLIGLIVVANFVLTVLPGDAVRVAFYFWYPIDDRSWSLALTQQIIPFIGLCLLLIFASLEAFEHKDHLGV
ncbi:hypothetical protein [Bombiscardovia coagulans]|uniref:Beta-carotene 15,15'-monooxygenase n=1 Tax=Bombiscardovia coagulans TaxID=686666 RepID=A0A261ETR7_9BIFI|nr:hypothetical protein [Bombiscardovia coagulans]OZG50251.1 beta-carotene 15,15'-monooxygenase [Bombiscardovia coagulans]